MFRLYGLNLKYGDGEYFVDGRGYCLCFDNLHNATIDPFEMIDILLKEYKSYV